MRLPICSTMTNKELFYYVGKCLTLDEHPMFQKEIIRDIESDSIDWQKFVSICSNHLILPAIYLKFKSYDILSYLPEELSEHLEKVYQLNYLRNEQILKQAHEIIKVLNENEIQPIILKGVANLLDNLYNDPGERMIGDIDILVSEKDYLRSANILQSKGYARTTPCWDVENLKHYPRLFKDGVPADIEIHRLPVSSKYRKWFNPEILDKEKKIIEDEIFFFIPSDHHKAIHNFIHSQLDHRGHLSGIVSFRDIYDLFLLSKRIDINQTIPAIKSKQKAMVYFAFAGKALGLRNGFCTIESLSAKLFMLRHDLNWSSRTFYCTYRGIFLGTQFLFLRSGLIVQAFYSKSARRLIVNRLSDTEWYKYKLKAMRPFFL